MLPRKPEPDQADVRSVRHDLLAWYAAARRDLPWRGVTDPYAVLVSEVMLQQTQAARVAERLGPFLARFPTAAALAEASPADVLAAWNGLGYNRRALALQRAAAAVARAGWPRDVDGLRALPGIGPYTARAVASLAFGGRVGVVDTNVRRWLVRRFAVTDAPRALQALADRLAAADGGSAADWTHASMEFGATICRARAPRCDACPVAQDCPSRGDAAAVPVPRQAPLRGTDRAYRGAVVRVLAASPSRALPAEELRRHVGSDAAHLGPPPDDATWRRVVSGLERDRLVHRAGGLVRLGAATIGP